MQHLHQGKSYATVTATISLLPRSSWLQLTLVGPPAACVHDALGRSSLQADHPAQQIHIDCKVEEQAERQTENITVKAVTFSLTLSSDTLSKVPTMAALHDIS
jgi:hypothetical protein